MNWPGPTILGYEKAQIDVTVRFVGGRLARIDLNDGVRIDAFVLIVAAADVVLGDGVHIASHVGLRSHEGLKIGAGTVIAAGTQIYGATDRPGESVEKGPVSIGTGCLVGANSVVLPNTKIGDGAFFGAGSVIQGDYAGGALYVGSPARKVRDL